jgi:hypothetical protein
MATETARQSLDRRDLFRRLSGRRIELTTVCKTFDRNTGQVKDVFDDFFLFITIHQQGQMQESTRHWVLLDAVTVVTEVPKLPDAAEEMEIER